MHKHIDSIRAYKHLLRANVLIMQEKWALPTDPIEHYLLTGFSKPMLFFSTHNFNRRPHDGMMVNIKPSIKIETFTNVHDQHGQVVYLHLRTHAQSFEVCAVNRRPNSNVKGLTDLLEQVPLDICRIVLGDFNIDHLKPSKNLQVLQNHMSSLNLLPTLKGETTEFHSCLDQIDASLQAYKTGVLETSWSDQKTIWINL